MLDVIIVSGLGEYAISAASLSVLYQSAHRQRPDSFLNGDLYKLTGATKEIAVWMLLTHGVVCP